MSQRVAFRLWVQPERLEEYKRLHQQVWPELLADMHEAGICNDSIFADGPELFAYLECDDWDTTSAALARSDANRRWQDFMRGTDRLGDVLGCRLHVAPRADA